MNIRAYIESGIIELYVMGTLTDAERAEVEALAQQHPEIKAEIDDVQAVMQIYAQAHAIEPKPELKEAILNKIKAELPISTPQKTEKTLPHPPLSILSLLAGILAMTSIYFYQKYQNTQKAKEKCEQEQSTQTLKNQKMIADLQQKVNILKNADTKIIELKGLKIAPDAKAVVYWNVKEKATFLTIQNLPKPKPNKQYQLWAIVDKKPVDAGIFTYDTNELHTMKPFDHAEAFAVTLEPQGGSPAPTLENMYVLGTL